MVVTQELEEFLRALETLGHTGFDRDTLRHMMADHDLDDSGTIDADEFSMIMVNNKMNLF